MVDKKTNDLHYVCSLIEFLGRATKNTNRDIALKLGIDGLKQQFSLAEINHCLTFDEVADEVITQYGIENGGFDRIANCRFQVPGYIQIGSVYRDLILSLEQPEKDLMEITYEVFTSFISAQISNFNASTFYESPSYLYHSYLAGELIYEK